MSWPVTLADRPLLMRRLWAREGEEYAVFDASLPTTLIIAPCCGRHTPADTVVSLAGLVTEIRGGNSRPKENLDWACDGCLHLLILDESNGWTWCNLFAALGAPPEVVRHHLAREVEHAARLDADRRDADRGRQGLAPLGFNPQEVYETAHENLPTDLNGDRATQRPDV